MNVYRAHTTFSPPNQEKQALCLYGIILVILIKTDIYEPGSA